MQLQKQAAAAPPRRRAGGGAAHPATRATLGFGARARPNSLTLHATKGFGADAAKPSRPADGCPCGSGLLYKACCKPHHQPRAPPPETVEATVRARFSAVVKKEMPFLLKTFHPNFHAVQYNVAPGEASEKLEDDMWRTCKDFEMSNLRILSIKEDADKPGEWLAEIKYRTENIRAVDYDGNGNRRRLIRMERDRFVRGDGGWWQLCDYQLADVPEALAKAAGRAGEAELPPLERRGAAGEQAQKEDAPEPQQRAAA